MKEKSKLLSFEVWNSHNPHIDKVKQIDRNTARIVINSNPSKFRCNSNVWATREDGFSIRNSTDELRISKNNRFYYINRDKTYVIYKDGKYWFKNPSKVLQLNYILLYNFVQKDLFTEEIKNRILGIFEPVRFIGEHREQFPLISSVGFNTIIKHKLYSLKKLVSYAYKCDYPEAVNKAAFFKKGFADIKDTNCYNYHILNQEFLKIKSGELIIDTIRIGKLLGKRVNLAWSVKRLTLEHDNWSQILDNITGEFFDYNLNIHKSFLDLAEKVPELVLCKSSRELIEIGRKEMHCVGSYSSIVDSGDCAIFQYKGYTAQILRNPYRIAQIKGSRNSKCPEDIERELARLLVYHTLSVREPDEVGDPFLPF